MKPSSNAVPKHVGIILDGNRRFAKRLLLKPWRGHEWGARKIEKLFEWCEDIGIKELTLYAFSVENFHSRPRDEFEFLMDLFRENFIKFNSDERIEKNEIRLNFIGRLYMFPEDIQESMKKVMEKTKKYKKHIINIALAYGGRSEIVDATKRIAQEVKEGKLDIEKINEELFADHLYMKDEPDMIIRTGGEKRSSNFLNYQAAYSEWFYLEKMWPEFEKEDFIQCIEEFKKRDRRFGR